MADTIASAHNEAYGQHNSKGSAEKYENQQTESDAAADNELFGETSEELQNSRLKQIAAQGNAHFHRLGWKRLAIVTIVEAIALGALSLPAA